MEDTRTKTAVRIGCGNADDAQQRVGVMAARVDEPKGNGAAVADVAELIDLHIGDWAAAIAEDCTRAQRRISISAISMMPPLRRAETGFFVLWDAWCKAGRRGVEVVFHLPQPMPAHPATLRNVRAAQLAQQAAMKTRFAPAPRLLHAKTVVIDSATVWIGSGNMTAAAACSNHEMYVRFDNKKIAERIEKYLHEITQPGA